MQINKGTKVYYREAKLYEREMALPNQMSLIPGSPVANP
jgi:hypothetical protein